ncbi:phage tail assembly chaperone [Sphingopyxis sp.]|uniref:phage tail assembly chaperone n=1 Tax=Sphingopyxis sp. TaxID=1908224 RepID=UPI003D80CB33
MTFPTKAASEPFFGPGAAHMLGLMARVAGWRPDEFWAATPADVRAVLAGWGAAAGDAAAVDGAALAVMMEQFPDG